MSDPILEHGAQGPAVKKAQLELIHRYYLPAGADDGDFRDKTRKAVIQYQLDRSANEFYEFKFPLPINGIVGPETWARLAPATVKLGTMDDNGVRLLQEILTSMGPPFDPKGIDGDFGEKTKEAGGEGDPTKVLRLRGQPA